ncbi:MAG: stage III sporulation protein AE [Bacillota bacterium]
MKTKIRTVFCLLLLFLSPTFAAGQERAWEDIYKKQMGAMDTSELERQIGRMDGEARELLKPYDWRNLPGQARDENKIGARLLYFLTGEFRRNLGFLGMLIILVVLTSIMQHFQDAFGGEGPAKAGFYICYLTLLVLVLVNFAAAMKAGRETVSLMVDFMYAILPVLLSLLGAAGGMVSIHLLQPILLAGIITVADCTRDLVFPLFFLSGVLGVFSQFGSEITVKNLAGLLRECGTWLLGLAVSIFLAMMSVKGINAALVDGVSLRTAKFMTGTLVPIVGSNITDALDMVAGCALLLKSTLGLFGVMAVFLICAFPFIKLLVLALLYRLAGALLQPTGEQQIHLALREVGNSLQGVLAVLFVVTMMFIAVLTFVVVLGNLSAVSL